MSSEKRTQFQKSDKVLCFHGPLVYEAKILDSRWVEDDAEHKGMHYHVHYKGWKTTWDEWVPETRVLEWNDANLQMQQQLNGYYNMKKSSSNSSTSSSTSSPGSQSNSPSRQTSEPGSALGKRNSRESSPESSPGDESFPAPLQVRIDIPDSLKGLLVDDWEYVTRNQQLVSLPRHPNVNELLERYKQSKQERNSVEEEQVLEEVLDGIRMYFNNALGMMLLYRFERDQYAVIRKQYPDKEMTDIYGAEHLLRLFVQMRTLIAQTSMESDAVTTLTDHISDILLFMQNSQDQLFLAEYENVTPGYVSLSNGN